MSAPRGRPARGDPSPRLTNLVAAVALDLVSGTEQAVADATGLSAVEATALTALANVAQGRSIEVLRGLVGLSQPGCARLVDRLVARGHVERGHLHADRRVVTVHLTAAGRRAVEAVLAARADLVRSRLATLEPARAAALEQILAEVAAAAVHRPADANTFCRSCDPAGCGHPEHCPTTRRALELGAGRPERTA